MPAKSTCYRIAGSLLEYDTLKTVHIKSWKVGAIFRFLQLLILGYIIGYAIVAQKSYQAKDTATSSVITKVKGVAVTCNDVNTRVSSCPNDSITVWDVADYVVPSQEANAFFVISNVLITPNQTQSGAGWDEDPHASIHGTQKVWYCKRDSDCPKFSPSRNGALTGQCNTTSQRCRVFGWGPVELSILDNQSQVPGNYPRQMPAVANYTVFIKNNIFFPNFNRVFSNTGLGNQSSAYLTSCLWDRQTAPYCPVFQLGSIIADAGITEETFLNSAMVSGAVIVIQITYNCNLDQNTETCAPSYKFTRIDEPNEVLSKGYNFRFAHYSTDSRTLYKAYGLRFIFMVSGTAGQFSIVPTLIAFGSGLGLLGLATIVADLLVLKCLKNSKYYAEHKYEIVEEDSVSQQPVSINNGNSPNANNFRKIPESTPLLSHA